MKCFSTAVLLALIAPSEAFLSSTSRKTFLAVVPNSLKQPALFVSTELTAEGVGQSSDSDSNENESDVTVAVDQDAASTTTDDAGDSASIQANENSAPRVQENTLFIGNLPFGKHFENR